MSAKPAQYHAYLLRLWDANSNGRPAGHASLEDPHTGERRGFADLEQLSAFLAAQIGGQPEEDGAPPATADD